MILSNHFSVTQENRLRRGPSKVLNSKLHPSIVPKRATLARLSENLSRRNDNGFAFQMRMGITAFAAICITRVHGRLLVSFKQARCRLRCVVSFAA